MTSRYTNFAILSAREGHSLTQRITYITGTSLRSGVTGERFTCRGRNDVAVTGTLLPEGVDPAFSEPGYFATSFERAEIRRTPKRAKPSDPTSGREAETGQTKAEFESLIQKIDDPGEKLLTTEELNLAWRDNAQLGYSFILGLSHEFTLEQNTRLVGKFIKENLTRHGFVCHYAIHRPSPKSPLNWHVHIVAGTRSVCGLTVGNKIRGVIAEFGAKPGEGDRKGKGYLSKGTSWPDRWEAAQLESAGEEGVDLRFAPKSAISEPHLGPAHHNNALSWLREEHETIQAEATEAVMSHDVLVELMTETRPTFSASEVKAALARHRIPDDMAEIHFEALRDCPQLLPLFDRITGGFSGRFTTRMARDQERRIHGVARDLARKSVSKGLRQALELAATTLASQLANDRSRAVIAKTVPELGRAGRLLLIERVPKQKVPFALALLKVHRQAGFRVLGLSPSGAATAEFQGVFFETASLLPELRRQAATRTSETPSADAPKSQNARNGKAERPKPASNRATWDRSTCLVLEDADRVDAESYKQLLVEVKRSGARLILLGRPAPRHAIGRGGAYALVRAATANTDLPAVDAGATLNHLPPDDPRQPSMAYAAGGDRSRVASGRSHAAEAGSHNGAIPALPAPRPWRWPGDKLAEILNLSTRTDCEIVEARLCQLNAEDLLVYYRALPTIRNAHPDGRANTHPLAHLHRSIWRRLEELGIDEVTGLTRVNCLEIPRLEGRSIWPKAMHLRPRRNYVDIRWLLDGIDGTKLSHWRRMAEKVEKYPRAVLRDIVEGLDDAFNRAGSDDVRLAINFAKLQIWLLAKDTGRDLHPEIAREDLLSHLSLGSRLIAGTRLVDDNGNVEKLSAANLSAFAKRPLAAVDTTNPAPETSKLDRSPPPRATLEAASQPKAGRDVAVQPTANVHANIEALARVFVATHRRDQQLGIGQSILEFEFGRDIPVSKVHLEILSLAKDAARYLRQSHGRDFNPVIFASFLQPLEVRLGYIRPQGNAAVDSPDQKQSSASTGAFNSTSHVKSSGELRESAPTAPDRSDRVHPASESSQIPSLRPRQPSNLERMPGQRKSNRDDFSL